MKIGQISFSKMTTPVDRPYGHPELGSKYQHQVDATPSKMHLNGRPT
jgi:dCTP deaminase